MHTESREYRLNALKNEATTLKCSLVGKRDQPKSYSLWPKSLRDSQTVKIGRYAMNKGARNRGDTYILWIW